MAIAFLERLLSRGSRQESPNPAAVVLTPDLEQRLRQQYEWYKPHEPESPYIGCMEMSGIVSQQYHLYLVRGNFLLDGPSGPRTIERYHCWNEDENGVSIDYTHHQFDTPNPLSGWLPEEERGTYEQLAVFRP